MSSDSKRSRKAPGTIFVSVLKPSMLIEPHYFNLIVHFTSNSGIVTRSEREVTMRLLVRWLRPLGQTLVQCWTNVIDVGTALNQCLINKSVSVETGEANCQANTRNMIPRVWCLPGGHGREWRLVLLSHSLGVALRLCKLWPVCLTLQPLTGGDGWMLGQRLMKLAQRWPDVSCFHGVMPCTVETLKKTWEYEIQREYDTTTTIHHIIKRLLLKLMKKNVNVFFNRRRGWRISYAL